MSDDQKKTRAQLIEELQSLRERVAALEGAVSAKKECTDQATSTPPDPPEHRYRLQDLIDMEQFQMLQDRLNEIYSFPSAIIDNEGNILTATAWQDICTKFHRQDKESEKECIKSDQYILDHIHEACPAVSYRCPHGLVDNATPIVIDGVHYGNYFTGQFFLEPPDLGFFRQQARRYGFDEAAYLEAVQRVPVWTKTQLDSYLFFIRGLIEVISSIGLKNLRALETGERIRRSEERYKSLIRTAMDGFWLADDKGRLLQTNDTYCRMSGYSNEQLLTMGIADLDALESPTTVVSHIEEVRQNTQLRFETKHRRKDGSVYDVEVSTQFSPGEGGTIVAFLRDITQRKQAELALQQQRDRTQEYLNVIGVILVVLERDQTISLINRKGCELLGYQMHELIGTNWFDRFVPAEERESIRDYFNKLIEGRLQQAEYVENIVETRTGEKRDVAWHNAVLYDADGRISGTLSSGEDITERKRAVRALRQFKTIFDHANFGAAIADLTGTLTYINACLASAHGYTAEELVGARIAALHTPQQMEKVEPLLRQLVTEGYFAPQEIWHQHRDGHAFPMLMTGMLVKDDNGNPQYLAATALDITESKALEHQLQQAQKMESVGRLAGGVAHDFNNMLQVILVNTELVLAELDPSQQIYSDLQEVLAAAKRSADLTRQLLAFARRQTVSPRVIDLNESVNGSIRMLRRLIGEDIELVWCPAEALGQIMIDPSQIDQILANLCVNARDAITGVGRVTIETGNVVFDSNYCADHAGFTPGDYVLLAVSDSGCGMSKDILEHAFEPFFTTKRLGEGTGLGLATVYGIVKQNEGFVNVYSEPGCGTTFRMYFPRRSGEASPAPSDVTIAPPLEGGVVLLVEDELSLLRTGRIMLERLGCCVIAASSATEAIAVARGYAGNIQLLITDVVMPEMNGRELAEQVVAIQPNIRCLYMSGYTANVIAHHGVLDRGVHFIQKPFSLNALATSIREVMKAQDST